MYLNAIHWIIETWLWYWVMGRPFEYWMNIREKCMHVSLRNTYSNKIIIIIIRWRETHDWLMRKPKITYLMDARIKEGKAINKHIRNNCSLLAFCLHFVELFIIMNMSSISTVIFQWLNQIYIGQSRVWPRKHSSLNISYRSK